MEAKDHLKYLGITVLIIIFIFILNILGYGISIPLALPLIAIVMIVFVGIKHVFFDGNIEEYEINSMRLILQQKGKLSKMTIDDAGEDFKKKGIFAIIFSVFYHIICNSL